MLLFQLLEIIGHRFSFLHWHWQDFQVFQFWTKLCVAGEVSINTLLVCANKVQRCSRIQFAKLFHTSKFHLALLSTLSFLHVVNVGPVWCTFLKNRLHIIRGTRACAILGATLRFARGHIRFRSFQAALLLHAMFLPLLCKIKVILSTAREYLAWCLQNISKHHSL